MTSAKRKPSQDLETETVKKRPKSEPNGNPNGSAVSKDLAQRLSSVLQVIDVHGVLDVELSDSRSVWPSLRSALLKSATFEDIRARHLSRLPTLFRPDRAGRQIVARASAEAALLRSSILPPLPFEAVKGSSKQRRTPEELETFETAKQARQIVTDSLPIVKEELEAWLQQVLSILSEFEFGSGVKSVQGNGIPSKASNGPTSTASYALHRTLAGVTDVFTSSNVRGFHKTDLKLLAELKDTDLTSVGTRSTTSSNVNPVPSPKLAEVNPRPRVFHEEQYRTGSLARAAPVPAGVIFLQYDAYSSFAPSYDSSGATMSYDDSSVRRLARNRLDLHRIRPQIAVDSEYNPWTSDSTAEVKEEMPADLADVPELGLSNEDVSKIMSSLPSSSKTVTSLLRRSAVKLRSLQLAQWQRLKMLAEQKLVDQPVSDGEKREMVEVLTILGGLVPAAGKSILPANVQIERSAEGLEGGRPISYGGTLDKSLEKVVRESTLAPPPPPVVSNVAVTAGPAVAHNPILPVPPMAAVQTRSAVVGMMSQQTV